MVKLGVNIDHIATLREARQINEPDPVMALGILKEAGADQVTIHLREDRRHIHDRDARLIVETSFLPVNIECSINPEIIDIIAQLKPHRATLVPERREEVTTEGGLDVVKYRKEIEEILKRLNGEGVEVSLFIDPSREQILEAGELGVQMIELHTGRYANLHLALNSNLNRTHHPIFSDWDRERLKRELEQELRLLRDSVLLGKEMGLAVAAGHGLNYQNVREIVQIPGVEELNIGHSIIANSIFLGLKNAIEKMKRIIDESVKFQTD
ncbi:MAG: pyridoxine 5'-phosphate synthase [Epsilonproteobacteria bacterium]|nr:pyridoxine 5'-phosphate synthase [Campylobacterota bacterium]NPA88859.1 pyridoxine 5'-phosphate synthase [Campylobacterota bacterium]